MDATRTAQRFTGQPATIVYRRTWQRCPPPKKSWKVRSKRATSCWSWRRRCASSGKRAQWLGWNASATVWESPAPTAGVNRNRSPGSEFVIETDTVIVAVGQLPELTFLDDSAVSRHKGGGVVVDEQTGNAGPNKRICGRRCGHQAQQHHRCVRRWAARCGSDLPPVWHRIRAAAVPASSAFAGRYPGDQAGACEEGTAAQATDDRAGRNDLT